MGRWWLGAALLLTACSGRSVHSRGLQPPTPSTTPADDAVLSLSTTRVAAPTTTSTPRDDPIDIHSVDWKAITVPGEACFSATPIKLVGGRALIPDSQRGNPTPPGMQGAEKYDSLTEIGPPYFGDFETPASAGPGRDAAVSLWCDNNGGTASGDLLNTVAVYSVRGGALRFIGLVTARQQHPDALPTMMGIVKVEPGRLVVEELWYGTGDMTCCPTGKATSTWLYSGGMLSRPTTRITASPRADG